MNLPSDCDTITQVSLLSVYLREPNVALNRIGGCRKAVGSRPQYNFNSNAIAGFCIREGARARTVMVRAPFLFVPHLQVSAELQAPEAADSSARLFSASY